MPDAPAPPKPYDLTLAEHDYADWSGSPLRTLLICTHPRSGSTLLGEALYFAGGLGCPLEYFHHGFRPSLAARWNAGTLAAYVRAVHHKRTDRTGTLSVKLFWSDVEALTAELDPIGFGDLAGRRPEDVDMATYRKVASLLETIFPNPGFVHLERKDRVRQAVSGLTASQTGVFRIVPSMGSKAAKAKPEYDFARIDSLVATSDYCHQHWQNFFDATCASPIPMTYEGLVSDYPGNIGRLFDALGSSAPIPPIRMKRQSDSDNEAFVLRYLRDRRARASNNPSAIQESSTS